MLCIVYVSSAVRLLDDSELVELLQTSRANNARDDITGMLLYKGGNFMQVIEGPDEAILALYAKIRRDSRHKDIVTLIQEPIEKRQFSNWSMAFQNVDKLPSEILSGYSPFLSDEFTANTFRQHPHVAYKLLLNFRASVR